METKRRKSGFTIVELLTVMAIIAILMGLLVPALQQVRKLAKDVSQKAEFHTMDVALEAFHGDYGMYPESSVSLTTVTKATVGAQKLAEALVGRDLLGFDPKSTWDVYNDSSTSSADYQDIYANTEAPQSSSDAQVAASLKRRIGPYLNTEAVEAFQVNQLFTNPTTVYRGYLDNAGGKDTTYVSAPVLTDVYRAKRVTLPNGSTVMAGTPILYYKADTTSTSFPDTRQLTTATTDDIGYTETISTVDDYIYDINDNDELVKLYQMMKPTSSGVHHFDESYSESVDVGGTAQTVSGVWLFYDTITNPKMTSQPRPYNMNSYILISAGADGIYGTKDDITNFEK